MKIRVIRTSTIPISLNILLKGQLRFLNKYFDVIGISSSDYMLDELGSREGIKVLPVNMNRGISPMRDLFSLIKLYLIFRKEKPLIVHSITPKAGLLTMLAAKMAGVPIRMHTFTGLIFPTRTGLMQKLLIKMDQLLCWAATNIYPEGNGVKKDLINFNITSKPLKILANGNVNGIDLGYFSLDQIKEGQRKNLCQDLGIRNTDFVFVFVGRLVGDKGINELISAFSKINNNNIKLLLVGSMEPELDPLTKQSLDQINTNPSIKFVGFQKDVRPYLAISDALVFPSYREGFPNVVMQAGAMELPCVVSDINGCNEIIINNENGIIIPVKSVDEIYHAMIKLFSDTEYYQRLKENSRDMIKSRYEQTVVWNALLDEYNRLLGTLKK